MRIHLLHLSKSLIFLLCLNKQTNRKRDIRRCFNILFLSWIQLRNHRFELDLSSSKTPNQAIYLTWPSPKAEYQLSKMVCKNRHWAGASIPLLTPQPQRLVISSSEAQVHTLYKKVYVTQYLQIWRIQKFPSAFQTNLNTKSHI